MGLKQFTPSVIVYGPQGCGKTTNAANLAEYFGAKVIQDGADWPKTKKQWGQFKATEGQLWLIADDKEQVDLASMDVLRRVMSFKEAMKRAGLSTTTFNRSGSKYLREIKLIDGRADVYAVLVAFGVTCPARQHAVKKLLCAGLRSKGSELQDLNEARDAVDRAIQLAFHAETP